MMQNTTVIQLTTPNKYYFIFWILEPCEFTGYTMEMVTFDKNSKMAHNSVTAWFQYYNITPSTTNGSASLYFQYQTTETAVSQKIKILNASSFISSVGGNLGLFLGFSFLDSLFVICKCVTTYIANRRS